MLVGGIDQKSNCAPYQKFSTVPAMRGDTVIQSRREFE